MRDQGVLRVLTYSAELNVNENKYGKTKNSAEANGEIYTCPDLERLNEK